MTYKIFLGIHNYTGMSMDSYLKRIFRPFSEKYIYTNNLTQTLKTFQPYKDIFVVAFLFTKTGFCSSTTPFGPFYKEQFEKITHTKETHFA